VSSGTPTADAASAGAAERLVGARSPYAEIIELAGRAAGKPAFYRKALDCIGRAFHSPYAALCVRLASEALEEEYHRGATDPGFWKAAVQAYLLESLAERRARAKLLSARSAALRVGLLAVPLFDPQGVHLGGLALVTPLGDGDARSRLAVLESLAALTCYAAQFAGEAISPETAAEQQRAAGGLVRAAAVESPEELAFSLTNTLRTRLGLEQVALGLVERQRVRLLSISGLDDVRPQSPGALRIRAAMEECLDLRAPIVCQAEGDWSSVGATTHYRLHRQWHDAAHAAAVASIPLCVASAPRGRRSEPGQSGPGRPPHHWGGSARSPRGAAAAGDRCVAVVSLRRGGSERFTPDEIEQIRKAVEPYAAALLLLRQARRGLLRHGVDAGYAAIAAVTRPGRLGAKIAAGAAALLVLWFLFGTLRYELTVPCVVAPAEVRHITAPFDAPLARAAATAGDRVRAGDVLCELDHRELDLQRAELESELAALEQEALRAMADNKPVEAQLARASQRLARAKLHIVERRIEQAVLRSPIDGVIVAGDLRRRIGSVLIRGEPLLEVGPLEHWTLELEAPEWVSADLSAGLRGRFASHARPEQAETFRLLRVRPRAEVREQRNVIVAEAEVDIRAGWMRPGTKGFAKVEVGRRRVCWVALHRMLDYLRLNFWL